jgi:hypothetical protein
MLDGTCELIDKENKTNKVKKIFLFIILIFLIRVQIYYFF